VPEYERALRLAGAAAALGEGTGVAFDVFGERAADVHLTTARRALGLAGAAAAWAAGQTMGPDELVRYAVARIEADAGPPAAAVEIDRE
jgi:hypothetical protein